MAKRGRPRKIRLEEQQIAAACDKLPKITIDGLDGDESAPDESAPDWWPAGALLNVTHNVSDPEYIVTLHPEQYDSRYPDRAMRFQNSTSCQNFVSKWYEKNNYYPLAR